MSKKLYVGNLGPQADAESLNTLFSIFGAVEDAYIISDPKTGQSKGFGFVVMENDAQALAAIAALDGKKCGDYTVKVQETKDR